MTRLRTMYLATEPASNRPRYALIVDEVANFGPAEAEAFQRFGRGIGAEGVLVTTTRVDLDDSDDASSSGEGVHVEVDPAGLGVAVAQSVRTYLETIPQRLRGGFGD